MDAQEKGLQQGIQQGIEKGKAEGEKAKAIDIACKIFKGECSLKKIIKNTGLTKEEIEALM